VVLLSGRAAPSFAQSSPSGAAPPPAAASGVAPPPAAASGPADASGQARAHFSEGVALAKQSQWQRAYVAFHAAWTLKEHPQIALNLGRAEMEIGKYRDAIAHFQYCITRSEAGDPDAVLARGWIVEARSKVAKLVIRVDTGGARLLVDDAFVGTAPLSAPVLVDPGEHLVRATLEDKHVQRKVVVEMGGSLEVALGLQPDASLPLGPQPARPVSARTAVLIGGGAGAAVGLGIGAVLGGLALEQRAKRDACVEANDRDCWIAGESERVTLARGSFAGFVGGGLLAAGTAAYLIFGPKDSRVAVSPAVSATGASFAITTHW